MKENHRRLIELYKLAADNAFGWASVVRGKDATPFIRGDKELSRQEAEEWMADYMKQIPTTEWLAQKPGRPTHLIGLAFRDMTKSAEEWETWGYRLTAVHDYLASAA